MPFMKKNKTHISFLHLVRTYYRIESGMICAQDFSEALSDDPFYEKIKEYVIGDSAATHEEAPSIKDPQAAPFKKKFDSLYTKAKAPKTLTLYRSHIMDGDDWEVGDSGVLNGYSKLLSCTDSKDQALNLAKARNESDQDSGDYDDDPSPMHNVLELKSVQASRIYFHHQYDKKVASHHVQEQEVLIDPNSLKFKVIAVFGD